MLNQKPESIRRFPINHGLSRGRLPRCRLPRCRLPRGQTTLSLVGLLTVMASVSGLGFLAMVGERPGRTPILTLSLSYPIERWPANDWVDENSDRVRALDGPTFHVRKVVLPTDSATSTPSASPAGTASLGNLQPANPLASLETSIAEIDPAMPTQRALLVYLNAHMAINDENALCLIGPESDPQQSQTWHNMEVFVQRYFEGGIVASGRPIVFLLDTNRLRQWLPAGLLHNDIAIRLKEVAEQHTNTNTSRRMGWLLVDNHHAGIESESRTPSPLSRFLCEALTGQRHGQTPSQRTPRSPFASESWVDSNDLRNAVQTRFNQWTREQGGETPPQVCWIETGGPQPLPLAPIDTSTRSVRKRLSDVAPQIPRVETHAKLTNQSQRAWSESLPMPRQLKKDLDSFQGTPIAHRRALQWIHLHADAERLQSIRFGGQHLIAQLPTRHQCWHDDLRRLQGIARQDEASIDLSEDADSLHRALETITMRAIEHAEAWDAVAGKPTRATLADCVATSGVHDLEPCPLMVALLRDPKCDFWKSPPLVPRFAAAQATALRTVASIPVETFSSVRQWIDEIDRARRHAADMALLTPEASESNLENALEEFESCVEDRSRRITLWSAGWQTAHRANVELPFFWTFVLNCREPWAQTTAVKNFLRDWRAIRESLEHAPTRDSLVDAAFQKQFQHSRQRVDSFLDQVETTWRQQRLTSSTDFPVTFASGHRDPVEFDLLNQTFAEIGFQIAPSPWAASRVRQQLRIDATTLPDWNRDGFPQWDSTLSMQSDEFAERRMSEFRDHHRRHRLYAEIRRVIEDFWRGSVDEPRALFDRLASSMLASLAESSLAESMSPEHAIDSRQGEFQERLQRCRKFLAEGAVRPAAHMNGIQLAGLAVEADVYVESSEASPSDVVGTAMIRVSQPGGSPSSDLLGVSKVNWNPLPTREHFVRIPVRSEPSLANSPQTVTLSFRGHEFVGPVTGAAHARWVRREPVTTSEVAKVSLSPVLIRRRAVVFVVDASASMNEPAPIEQTRRGDETASKLDASRAAVLAATDRLWQQDCDLGMVIYGHRVAIDAQQGRTLIQKRYAKRFPFSFALPAYRDVELALPVGRFGTEQYADMEDRLTNLVPWGQSPLHLAINAAVDDLIQSGPHQSRDIVVITDGRNYQFNPTPDAVLSMESIIERARAQAIRVHVVGFAGETNQASVNPSSSNHDLVPVTQGTGGWQAAGVHDFVNALLRDANFNPTQLELVRQNASGESIGDPHTIQGGQTIAIETDGKTNDRWQLSQHGKTRTIQISAGDHLRLGLDPENSPGNDALPVHRQTESTSPMIWLGLQRPEETLSQRLGIYRPRFKNQTATFGFALQPITQLTAARPERVWVETTTVARKTMTTFPTAPPITYASSLVRWRPGHGIPVAEFTCDDWSSNADGYTIQVWTGTVADAESNALPLPVSGPGSWTAGNFPGHRFQMQRQNEKITLTIHYPDSGSGNKRNSMWIVDPDSSCDLRLTAEWYDPDGRLSVHEFVRIPTPGTSVKANSALTLTPASRSISLKKNPSPDIVNLISIAKFKRNAATIAAAHHGIVTPHSLSVGAATSRVSQRTPTISNRGPK